MEALAEAAAAETAAAAPLPAPDDADSEPEEPQQARRCEARARQSTKHSKAAEKKLLEKRITILECEGKIGRLDGLPRPKAREKEQLAKAASQACARAYSPGGANVKIVICEVAFWSCMRIGIMIGMSFLNDGYGTYYVITNPSQPFLMSSTTIGRF